jgi:SAF domain-containing protein
MSGMGAPTTHSAAVPGSPRPRRIATPSWFDARLVLGIVLVLGSVLVGARVVSNAKHTYPRVVVRGDLAAGTVLTAGDVELAQVQLSGPGRARYLPEVTDAVGKQLNRAVTAGELLPASALARPRPQTTVTVPLASGAAPDLRKGQRIELWVSTKTCPSVVVLPDVTVQAVHADGSGSFSAGTGGQDVVISVDPALADRVITALALDDGTVRAGVLVGAAAGSTAELADLDACSTAPR